MNSIDFHYCRNFLESMIYNNPDNKELLSTYQKLIEKKSEFDTAYFKVDAEIRNSWEQQQTERMSMAMEKGLIALKPITNEFSPATPYFIPQNDSIL